MSNLYKYLRNNIKNISQLDRYYMDNKNILSCDNYVDILTFMYDYRNIYIKQNKLLLDSLYSNINNNINNISIDSLIELLYILIKLNRLDTSNLITIIIRIKENINLINIKLIPNVIECLAKLKYINKYIDNRVMEDIVEIYISKALVCSQTNNIKNTIKILYGLLLYKYDNDNINNIIKYIIENKQYIYDDSHKFIIKSLFIIYDNKKISINTIIEWMNISNDILQNNLNCIHMNYDICMTYIDLCIKLNYRDYKTLNIIYTLIIQYKGQNNFNILKTMELLGYNNDEHIKTIYNNCINNIISIKDTNKFLYSFIILNKYHIIEFNDIINIINLYLNNSNINDIIKLIYYMSILISNYNHDIIICFNKILKHIDSELKNNIDIYSINIIRLLKFIHLFYNVDIDINNSIISLLKKHILTNLNVFEYDDIYFIYNIYNNIYYKYYYNTDNNDPFMVCLCNKYNDSYNYTKIKYDYI